jgi:DNA polymerase III alpha subunit (gram-positive type)
VKISSSSATSTIPTLEPSIAMSDTTTSTATTITTTTTTSKTKSQSQKTSSDANKKLNLPIWKSLPTSLNLEDKKYLFIVMDFEATGLNTSQDRFTQLAAACVSNTKDKCFSSYVSIPDDVHYPEHVQDLTGIRRVFLKTTANAKAFPIVWDEFILWLKTISYNKNDNSYQDIILIAHNGRGYDFKMLYSELNRYNIPIKECLLESNVISFLDTLELLKIDDFWNLPRGKSNRPESFNLGKLYKVLTGNKLDNAHNAIHDVQALIDILQSDSIKNKWKSIANKSLFMYDIDI